MLWPTGFPEGRTHPQALAKTDAMLDFAFSRMTAQPGPRFMAGDWNFDLDTLAVTSQLRKAGWVEAQDLWFSLTGQHIQHTCKGATRKDFLWMSPELAIGFKALRVDHEVFADHAVLIASFASGSAHLERFAWPCPKEIPWPPSTQMPPVVDFAAPFDPTHQYAEMWTNREAIAKSELGCMWIPSMGGRAQQTRPHRIVGSQAPSNRGDPMKFSLDSLDFLPCMPNSSDNSGDCRTIAGGLTRELTLGLLMGYMELDFGILSCVLLALVLPSLLGGPVVSMSAPLTLLLSLSFALMVLLPDRFLRLSLLR